MSEATYEENVQKVREIFKQVEYETILKMPLWMRLNFYAHKLSKAKADGHADNEINWNYINEMCVKDLSPFDYNRYKPVSTFEDFEKHSETQETMVLYRALYGECGLFVRPYDMFVEEVPEGKRYHLPLYRARLVYRKIYFRPYRRYLQGRHRGDRRC